MTLYEEVHLLKAYGNARIQKTFLKTLQSFLSTDCRPIIITDAGFMSPWLRAVQKLGWDYIGRIRRDIYYREALEQDWEQCVALHNQATSIPRYLWRG